MPERDWTWLKAVESAALSGRRPLCSNRARHHQPPAARGREAVDGGEQTNTGHSDQQGDAIRLSRRVDDRAPRLLFRSGEKTSLSLKSAANLSGKVIAGSS